MVIFVGKSKTIVINLPFSCSTRCIMLLCGKFIRLSCHKTTLFCLAAENHPAWDFFVSDWIHIDKDERHVARERGKARNLRRSTWWNNKLAAGICHYCPDSIIILTFTITIPTFHEDKK